MKVYEVTINGKTVVSEASRIAVAVHRALDRFRESDITPVTKAAVESEQMAPRKGAGEQGAQPTQQTPAGAVARQLNRRQWWHVPPVEGPAAYAARGRFLASSFGEAEFYGRPLDAPQRANVVNPLVGDEASVAGVLGLPPQSEGMSLEEIAAHDKRWAAAARARGYDAIAILSPSGYAQFRSTGKLPRSVELNDLEHARKVEQEHPEYHLVSTVRVRV